ncbi:hypothetical protein J4410_00220 [Candidatus Woesearchaeota archaeon]|nr:hypothetical protein [Candidatus Woesearchaeota archaeon]
MVWYPVLGVSIFWLGLVAAIILYAVMRKWYPMMYLISICLYIFTVGYVIDVFDLTKNFILLILAFSAAMMIFVGWYLSRGKVAPVKKIR